MPYDLLRRGISHIGDTDTTSPCRLVVSTITVLVDDPLPQGCANFHTKGRPSEHNAIDLIPKQGWDIAVKMDFSYTFDALQSIPAIESNRTVIDQGELVGLYGARHPSPRYALGSGKLAEGFAFDRKQSVLVWR